MDEGYQWEGLADPIRDALQASGRAMAVEQFLVSILDFLLYQLWADRRLRAELARRYDTMDHQPERSSWTEMVDEIIEEHLHPESPARVRVQLHHPQGEHRGPVLAIVRQSDAEDTSKARLGDYDQAIRVPRPDGRVDDYIIVVSGETTILDIACWAESPDLSLLLEAAVRMFLLRNKAWLREPGIKELSTSASGFAPDPRAYPHVTYVPLVRATIQWTRSYSHRRPARRVRYTATGSAGV